MLPSAAAMDAAAPAALQIICATGIAGVLALQVFIATACVQVMHRAGNQR